jgi:hypothetical protein
MMDNWPADHTGARLLCSEGLCADKNSEKNKTLMFVHNNSTQNPGEASWAVVQLDADEQLAQLTTPGLLTHAFKVRPVNMVRPCAYCSCG